MIITYTLSNQEPRRVLGVVGARPLEYFGGFAKVKPTEDCRDLGILVIKLSFPQFVASFAIMKCE